MCHTLALIFSNLTNLSEYDMQVTRDNYEDLFPEICSHIHACSFIAFDCEFTALRDNLSQSQSLFDDAETRYNIQRNTSSGHHSIISQIGLSVFKHQPEKNTFHARSYNFWISPAAVGSVDEYFVCQASSLEFLKRHNFDFNKFMYQGIPTMNNAQMKQLEQDLELGLLQCSSVRNLPLQDEDKIRSMCGELSVWISKR